MSAIRKYLLSLLACMLCLTAAGQGRNYASPSDKLSHLGVGAFAQDSLGNMWIATLAGLDCYNGYEYRHLVHDPEDEHSIRNDFVFSLLADGDLIWIGTAYGVDRYNVRSGQVSRVPGVQAPAYQLYKDSSGRVRVASVQGLGSLEASKDTIVYNTSFGAVNQIWEDSYSRLWMATDAGLAREDGTLFTLKDGRKARCCHKGAQGQWWIGTDAGILLFDALTGESRLPDGPFGGNVSLQRDQINFICEVAPLQLLIGTTLDGAWYYDIVAQKLSHNQPSKYNPEAAAELNCCYIDRQGNAWIGTYDRGFIIAGKQADYFNENKSLTVPLQNRFVTRIIEDSRHFLWIATRYDGLYRYSPSGNLDKISLAGVEPRGGDYLEGVFVDSKNRLWIAFESGLTLAGIDNSRVYKIASFPLDHVRCIKEDASGTIWIGAWNGLHRYDGSSPALEKVGDDNVVNITDVLPLSDGRLWLAAYAWDVFALQDGAYYQVDIPEEGRDMIHNVITMAEDSRGRIWLGSYGYGLLCLEGDSIVRLTSSDGLPDNNILSFQEDFSGNMWVSTFHGIARIKLDNNLKDIEIQDFPGLQYHEKSGCRAADGTIYFGGNHGLTSFDPKSFSAPRQGPAIHLEDLKIGGESVQPGGKGSVLQQTIAYTDRIELDHRQRSFSLDYAGNDFYSSNNLTYRYRLRGFDKDWVDASTYRRASYSNLKPGDYVFEVVAIGEDGSQSPAPARLKIHVKQVPWLSWWALLAYSLAALVLTFFLLRSAINARLASQRAEMERSEKEREREMSQMKTMFFTNISHELRTPLTLISAPVEKLLSQENPDSETGKILAGVHRNASRMLMLIGQLMDFSKIENGVYSLGVKYTDVIRILAEIVDSFAFVAGQNHLQLSFKPHRPSLNIWVDEDKLTKIMDNLLTNAIKYTPEGGTVEVVTGETASPAAYDLPSGAPWLEISVLDNGCGVAEEELGQLFVRYKMIDSSRGRRPDYSSNGIGLHYTKNIVEKHHGKIKASLRKGGGMDFSFVLPESDVYADSEKLFSEVPGQDASATAASPAAGVSPQKPAILVVEDNAELRAFIAGLLSPQFSIFEAPDGQKAWEMIARQPLDMVVSDVIMPNLSGYELCARIKDSAEFCHLLVVLLTAKSTPEEQVEGLENGADAYICKPFRADYLVMTIRNLLNTRAYLKQYFTVPSTPEQGGGEIELNPQDKSFLDRLSALMESHLAEADLNIDYLAREMGYSRTAFYLRIKRLTGNAPNDFVRDYRFKAAAEAIKAGEKSLSDIAEQCGFGSYSYFSKAFKKHFGVSPKEYRTKD